MIDKDLLMEICRNHAFSVTPEQAEKFDRYAQLLVEWNEKINLTAITQPREIIYKHFLDSLTLLDAVEIPQEASMIDVGTGAGFPSVPVKIVRQDMDLTLLDSLNKRIQFLKNLCEDLNLSVNAVHGRGEEKGKDPEMREQYDIATARAVANLRDLAEYCLPFVKVGGVFAALKGYEIEKELETARKAITVLGGQVETVKKFPLYEDQKRAIIVVRKTSHTPAKYPRNKGQMSKKPLV